MFRLDKLLIPIDFYHGEQEVLKRVRYLGEAQGCEVTLLHVADRHGPAPDPDDPAASPEAMLARLAGQAAELGLETKTLIKEGPTAETIIRTAAEIDCHAIVMSTDAKSLVDRLMLNSAYYDVMRSSPVPVVVMPPRYFNAPGPEAPDLWPRHVLCPVGDDVYSYAALPFAYDLAKARSASLTLAHVSSEKEYETERQRCEQRVHEMLGADPGLTVEIEIVIGRVVEELMALVDRSQTDLVIMSTHGRKTMSQIATPSISEQVIPKLACPAITVRPELLNESSESPPHGAAAGR